MPVITVEAPTLTKEQKKKLVKDLTVSAADIMKVPENTIYVFLKENETDNVGVGGKLFSELKKG